MATSHSRSLQEEKESLKIQIKELNRLKTEIKHCLNTSIFNSETSKIPSFETVDLSEIQVKKYSSDVFTIKNELFDFSGIRCIKFTKDEYIFQFVAKDRENRSYVYSVQFFKVDNKGVLGKWIMPFFVDMDLILKETPLDNIAYGVQFIRNCKRYIDCYYDRMNQFIALKKSMGGFTNYTFTADLSYRYIHLVLFRVYNVQSRDYVNIIVYLVYDLKETRPQKIMVDSVYGPPLPKATERGLKTYLKPFRKLSLNEALENILKTEDNLFFWKNTDIEEGEETSSEEFVPQRKRRRRTVNRDSESEIFFEKELKKNKRRNITKKKLSGPSEEETVRVVDLNKARKPLLKKKKKKGFVKSKLKKPDISTFFTKKNEDKSAPELKDSNQSERDDHLEEHRPFERKMAKPTEISVKQSAIELVALGEKNKRILVNLKNIEKKDATLIKIKELDTFGEGRVLRSTANSPAKVAPPKTVVSPKKVTNRKKVMTPKIILSPKKDLISKKIVTTKKKKALKQVKTTKRITTPQKSSSPKKVVSREKVVTSKKVASKIKVKTPKKIVSPKKVAPLIKSPSPKLPSKKAVAPKITITSNTSQPQMKQTKIKFPISSESSLSADIPGKIELDYKAKLSKTKVVTSTPMRLNRKDLKRPFRLDISEIKSAKNPQAAKDQIESTVSLHEMQKIRLTRKMTAKRGV